MAFEPVYSLLSPSYPCKSVTGQAVVEARLLPSGFTVGRVLSASADVSVVPGEVFTGEVRYGGKVNFRVLVTDGEGVCRSLDYMAEFSDKLSGDGITANTQPFLSASVIDTDIVLATEHEIKLACVVEVGLFEIAGDAVNCLTSGGDGIYTHDDRLDFTRLSGKGSETFAVSDTVSVEDWDEILSVEPRCVILKRGCDIDTVRAEGVVVADIMGRRGNEVICLRQETPFTAELSCAGAHSSDICTVNVCLQSAKSELTFGDSTAVVLDYTLGFTFATFTEDVLDPVCDAFSVTNELLISGQSIKVCVPLPDQTFFERVEGKVSLDDTMPAVDEVTAVCGSRLSITGAVAGEGKLTVDGVVSCGIVYSAEDGTRASAAVELPFSITVSAPLENGDTVTATGIVSGVNVKLRTNGEIEVKADIAVQYAACRTRTQYVITELALGEERALPTGAVAIHIARKGETLWDAAKALGTTPENVLLQNPGIVLPLSGGERVLSYRCLSSEAK